MLLPISVSVQVAQGLSMRVFDLWRVVHWRPDKLKHWLPHVCREKRRRTGFIIKSTEYWQRNFLTQFRPLQNLQKDESSVFVLWALAWLTECVVKGVGDRFIPQALEEGQTHRCHVILVLSVEIQRLKCAIHQRMARESQQELIVLLHVSHRKQQICLQI